MRIILLGAPGAGKGTLGHYLDPGAIRDYLTDERGGLHSCGLELRKEGVHFFRGHGHQQATGGLGVAQEGLVLLGDGAVPPRDGAGSL